MRCKFIDDRVEHWGPEFAEILEIEYREEYDKIARMGAVTMLYAIADHFQDGALRQEIFDKFGVDYLDEDRDVNS